MKKIYQLLLVLAIVAGLGYAYWKIAIPTNRVSGGSELVMLGDLNDDYRWSEEDRRILDRITQDPFSVSVEVVWRSDMNKNQAIDKEDLAILAALIDSDGDPYAAEDAARSAQTPFPRPRELYRYVSREDYLTRPSWALDYSPADDSILEWLPLLRPSEGDRTYSDALNSAVYSEAVRFDLAWRKRAPDLQPVERKYAEQKLQRASALFESGEHFELLLALMELVEDAETLTVRNQPELPLKFLVVRDHMREMMGSPLFAAFEAGEEDWHPVLGVLSRYIQEDIGLTYDFETLGPARNVTDLENYLQRAEWQYYKSTTREQDFRALINYAQHDPRYLRAVSQTSRTHRDRGVLNHNLPMVLLFREALRIMDNDKKKAVGLLDEAIRIPYAWIKGIPREALPSSVALDNFLLPGNKEDGADKSRHWNVFGGISLYKSPQEAFDLALKREIQDLRDHDYSKEAMREFFRDMIANLNGMYHVMTVNPEMLR